MSHVTGEWAVMGWPRCVKPPVSTWPESVENGDHVPVKKCYGDRGKCRVPEVYSEARFKRDASSRRPSISELFGAAVRKKDPPLCGMWIGGRPDITPELEISFVASSLAPPLVGSQHREVSCRGRDGEQLPFR